MTTKPPVFKHLEHFGDTPLDIVVSPATLRAIPFNLLQKICNGDNLLAPFIISLPYFASKNSNNAADFLPRSLPEDVQPTWDPTRPEERRAIAIGHRLPGNNSVMRPGQFAEQAVMLAIMMSRHPDGLLVDNSRSVVLLGRRLNLDTTTTWGLFLYGILRQRVDARECWGYLNFKSDPQQARALGKAPFKELTFSHFARWTRGAQTVLAQVAPDTPPDVYRSSHPREPIVEASLRTSNPSREVQSRSLRDGRQRSSDPQISTTSPPSQLLPKLTRIPTPLEIRKPRG